MDTRPTPPGKIGLYDPRHEHDSCGVSFVANLHGVRSNALVRTGLTALTNLEHRGATGAESDTGDGAGILHPDPRRAVSARSSTSNSPRPVTTPPASPSCPPTSGAREGDRTSIESIVPTAGSRCSAGVTCRSTRRVSAPPLCAAMPAFRQLFVSDPAGAAGIALDRKTFVARKRIEHENWPANCDTYFSSLSSRTLVYKGMFTTPQLGEFFPDLLDPRIEIGAAARALAVLAPTRSRRGRSPTRTATSPTTARSTRCRATRTGCEPARRCCASDAAARTSTRRSRSARRAVRHGALRRGARAAAPRRPPAPSRGADDDPRGVGEPRRRWTREAGVLRVPRVADGAVGRPGVAWPSPTAR